MKHDECMVRRDVALSNGDADRVAALEHSMAMLEWAPEEWETARPIRSVARGHQEIRLATPTGLIDVVNSPFLGGSDCYFVRASTGPQFVVSPIVFGALLVEAEGGAPGDTAWRLINMATKAARDGRM